MSTLREREQSARAKRGQILDVLRDRARVQALEIRRARDDARAAARRELVGVKGSRAEVRSQYEDERSTRQRVGANRWGVAESDETARLEIPDYYLPLWEIERANYPYTWAPDKRAERFLEDYVSAAYSDPDAELWLVEHHTPSEQELQDSYEAYYSEQWPQAAGAEAPF
ncbi:MAG: hypothetical protein Q8Q14_05300 [Gemmatimonadales bacterium]|nr:hypothetical protein [Gemmatimonadales bacterium]